MMELFSQSAAGTDDYSMIFGIVALIPALLYCYFGYALFRFVLTVKGIVIGAGLGFFVGGLIVAGQYITDNVDRPWPIFLACVLIGALVCGIIGFFLVKVALFLQMVYLGWNIAKTAGSYVEMNTASMIVIGIVVGVILGVLALIFFKTAIVLVTAIPGGLEAGTAISNFGVSHTVVVILSAAFILTGIIVQTILVKRKSNRED